MKKTFVLGLLLLISTGLFAAEKRIAIFETVGEGLSQDEINWIPSSVRRRLEANINDYTSYQLVDVHNQDAIKEVQKNAEKYAYDQATSIELGKLVSAELGVFTTITKAGGRYILSASVTNLTTGIRLSSITADSVEEPVILFDGAGCSVNKVFVKLCEDLGIKLSSVDMYVLLKGTNEDDDTQLKMTQEQISKYEQKQKELEKQIKEVSLSTDLDAETRKAKLEAEKALAEQQKQIAEERLERLRLQQQRLYEDQQQQKTRTAAQRQKIEEAAAKAQKQAEIVRKQKIDNLTVDNQIAVLEAKKQALLDIHNSVIAQENLIKQNANADYKARCEAIDAEPLRNGETDSNGKMLPGVKQMRDDRKLQIKREIEAKAMEDLQKIEGRTSAQETALYNDIQSDIKKLSQKRTVSSLEDSRILDIGNYAGDLFEWDTTVSLYINDVKIFGQKANIGYKNVSGKAPVIPTAGGSDKWNDYLDTVDLYDYMFRRNVPAITLEIDYAIEAMSEYYPSMYKMTLYEFRFRDTVSGNVVQTIQPAKSSYKFSVSPSVDISYYKSTAAVTNKDSDSGSSSKNVKSESIKTGKDAKKRTKSKVKTIYDQKNGGGARCNLGINFGLYFEDTYNTDTDFLDGRGGFMEGYMSFPFTTCFFGQIDFGWTSLPKRFDKYYCYSAEASYCLFDLGLNWRPAVGGEAPNFYALAGIGFAYGDSLIGANSRQDESLLVWKAGGGIDLPVSEFFCITVEGGYTQFAPLASTPYAKVGAAFTLPNLVFF